MAVKVFNRKQLGYSKIETIQNEIKVWERCKNNNIIKIFELYENQQEPDILLLMEKASFGQIQEDEENSNSIKKKGEIYKIAVEKGKTLWPESDINQVSDIEHATKWIFYQVALAMQYLHEELQTVHLDLKHQNILMGQQNAAPENEEER